jgi:hypothetical protein
MHFYSSPAVPQAQHSLLDLKTPLTFGRQQKYVDLHYNMKKVGKGNDGKKIIKNGFQKKKKERKMKHVADMLHPTDEF